MVTREPADAVGSKVPGTIMQLIEKDKGKCYIRVFCNAPTRLSDPIEVNREDIEAVNGFWAMKRRAYVSGAVCRDGRVKLKKDYKIVPANEVEFGGVE
jgi:hypothetical protein